jgi:FkbM family methyltransferase
MVARALANDVTGRLVDAATAKRTNTGGLALDMSHPVVTPTVRMQVRLGIYESAEIRVLESVLAPDLDVVELGASLGVLSAYVARALNPGRTLLCVEANRALLPTLTTNLKLTAPHLRWDVVNAAIDYSGSAQVDFLAGRSTWSGSVSRSQGVGTPVAACTLGELLASRPSLSGRYCLVMDIEGGEAGVAFGDEFALEGCQMLIAELHRWRFRDRQGGPEELRQQFAHLGFEEVRRDGAVSAFRRSGRQGN